MNKASLISLSVLSGLLLYVAWPVSPFTFVIFFALIPLLYVADVVSNKRFFFGCSYLALLVWNIGTTWWIWNSTDVGAVAAIAANALLMTLPWWGYRVFKRRYGNTFGLASLVIFWMAFEYIHLNWQLSWPWLTMGNVFAMHPNWVQWYEVTGTSGGTLWILLVNIFIYQAIQYFKQQKKRFKNIVVAAVLFIVPFIISYLIVGNIHKQTIPAARGNVIIVQPNIDPYNEKFDASTMGAQINTLIRLSEQQLDNNTQLVIWPETALSASVPENEIQNSYVYEPVFSFLKRHPNVTLLTGIETYKVYEQEIKTSTARLNKNDGSYYDVFNAAIAVKANEPLQFYAKSKLVPGVETLPSFLKWMSAVFEQFGGTTGGYGRSDSAVVFKGNNYSEAPIICYESIYGEYITDYVKRGATLLTIITNDGWWKNTPGHKQHLQYARLRAIETRRYVARSANTGISAVIDEKGNILQTQPWDKAAFIKAAIPALTSETFYVAHGDLLSKAALFLAALLMVWNIIMIIKQRRKIETHRNIER